MPSRTPAPAQTEPQLSDLVVLISDDESTGGKRIYTPEQALPVLTACANAGKSISVSWWRIDDELGGWVEDAEWEGCEI